MLKGSFFLAMIAAPLEAYIRRGCLRITLSHIASDPSNTKEGTIRTNQLFLHKGIDDNLHVTGDQRNH
jgi:hypothetical protein